ncbi:MAG TPA: heavy metal translocating P-type ATPase, partial [Candidatus Saccharimonadales bacterium]
IDTAVHHIQPNDRLLVLGGETVPVDAVILEGDAYFDESLLSGNTTPQDKSVGDEVLSGSVNTNSNGTLTMKALRTAHESHYERTVRLVKNPAVQQSPFVRLSGRYSIVFTALALVIAIAAWVLSGHVIRFLDVIVVATAYPLIFAAPTALAAGISRASARGIFIRNGSILERVAGTDTLLFDWSGTLTQGESTVDTVVNFKPFSKQDVLGLAASLGQSSPHAPLQAITREATRKHLKYSKAKHVEDVPGLGLEATLRGKSVLVGSLKFLEERGVNFTGVRSKVQQRQASVYVAVDGKAAGAVILKSELRPGIKQTLQALKRLRVRKLALLTSESEMVAESAAKQLGIDEYHAGLLTADKLRVIDNVPKTSRPTVFIGNGVHDAPMLTAADVGMAFGARSLSAGESADVVLTPDTFSDVAWTVTLAQRVLRIARQSIAGGSVLSLILMLVFATGKLPPLLGAGLLEVIVILTTLNTLRAHSMPSKKSL